jgi:cold shock CspA family protein
MKTDTQLSEAARFVARLLGARQTHREEVPDVIAAVSEALSGLRTVEAAPAAVPEIAEIVSLPSAPPRRRGRPPRVRTGFAEQQPAEVAPPPVPRLMRRADVQHAVPDTPAIVEAARSGTRTGLRGIVKWWDPRAQIGALRLPGHDDVAVDGDALYRAGIARLFKGQEIEASITIDREGASPRLIAVSLPGRPETDNSMPSGPLGGSRRHAKPVVIEMKKDAMRRVAARVEAEQLLGAIPRRARHDLG